MRNPHNRPRKVLVRRILSCHGSDCDLDPHTPKQVRHNRCVILTRVDHLDRRSPSRGWCTGDWTEGKVYKKHDHLFAPAKPFHYGGGFWEPVTIGPLPPMPPAEDPIDPTTVQPEHCEA